MLQEVFIYAGLPAMYSLAAVYKDDWHDIAGALWIGVSIIKLFSVLPFLGVVGFIIGIVHISMAVRYHFQKRKNQTDNIIEVSS